MNHVYEWVSTNRPDLQKKLEGLSSLPPSQKTDEEMLELLTVGSQEMDKYEQVFAPNSEAPVYQKQVNDALRGQLSLKPTMNMSQQRNELMQYVINNLPPKRQKHYNQMLSRATAEHRIEVKAHGSMLRPWLDEEYVRQIDIIGQQAYQEMSR